MNLIYQHFTSRSSWCGPKLLSLWCLTGPVWCIPGTLGVFLYLHPNDTINISPSISKIIQIDLCINPQKVQLTLELILHLWQPMNYTSATKSYYVHHRAPRKNWSVEKEVKHWRSLMKLVLDPSRAHPLKRTCVKWSKAFDYSTYIHTTIIYNNMCVTHNITHRIHVWYLC